METIEPFFPPLACLFVFIFLSIVHTSCRIVLHIMLIAFVAAQNVRGKDIDHARTITIYSKTDRFLFNRSAGSTYDRLK